MRRHAVRGFTLLEVLIVVGILALLAAMVIPKLFAVGQGAKIDLVQSQIGRSGPIGTALELYRQAMGTYPETGDGLQALTEVPGGLDDVVAAKWRGPYIDNPEALQDPWGNEYQYTFPGEKNAENMYDLWSYGPDGDDGSDDDIVNWLKDDDPRARLVNRR